MTSGTSRPGGRSDGLGLSVAHPTAATAIAARPTNVAVRRINGALKCRRMLEGIDGLASAATDLARRAWWAASSRSR